MGEPNIFGFITLSKVKKLFLCYSLESSKYSKVERESISFDYSSYTKKLMSTRPVCKFFIENKSCKFGDNCRYSHPELNPNLPQRPPAQNKDEKNIKALHKSKQNNQVSVEDYIPEHEDTNFKVEETVELVQKEIETAHRNSSSGSVSEISSNKKVK